MANPIKPPESIYLCATDILDSGHPDIQTYALEKTGCVGNDPVSKAVELYYAVRDDIRYDPYRPFYRPDHYRASTVLKTGKGFCITKAGLLCTLGRACGIPSRIGFADVRNHIATRQLLDHLGSDRFVYHGYTEFFLNDRWVKCTPAFNIELCRKHRVPPLEFDGLEDSIFHAYSEDNRKFMEYLAYHGERTDIPVDEIVTAWKAEYGPDRVQGWIDDLERLKGRPPED
ncbi:MAG: transglutaminase-like domain-containing protein [Thermodesulfobacteriota bacterium]